MDRFPKRFSRLLHVDCSKCRHTPDSNSRSDMRYNKYASRSEYIYQFFQENSRLINQSRFFPQIPFDVPLMTIQHLVCVYIN
jgi:hypothetical protein